MKILNGNRILIVDDDEMLREMLNDVFTLSGAIVEEAENGKCALEKIRNSKFDAVVSDIRMPGGDGIELAANVQSLNTTKPLMFVCSGFNDMSQAMVNKLDIKKVFEKPFDIDNMVRTVAEGLR
jgi:DNA-binding NtrC family response regulator